MKQNREIKFRVWDKELKEFSSWTNRDPHFDISNGRLFFWERTRNEDGSFGGDIILEDLSDRFILQQYTGNEDKNDVEIYEGDILKCDAQTENGHKEVLIGEVRFQDFEYVILTENDKWPCASFKVLDTKEIVGNIFENPELLKHE
jgi:uncharacterized phage protein (TIGR01671 family)